MSDPAYRIELSPNNRAGCKGNAECKNNNVKLNKGDIRFGTMVKIQDHQSWVYRHWGCVTPKILQHLKEICDGDMDLVDGYDELPTEWQEKVERAIGQGHVDDEDWKGDPDYNRPGKSGFGPRTSKKKQATEDTDEDATATKKASKKRKKADEDNDDVKEASVRKKAKGKAKPLAEKEVEQDGAEPKKPRGKKGKVTAEYDDDVSEEEPKPKPKKSAKAKSSKKSLKNEPQVEDDPESEVEQEKKAKQAKSKSAPENKSSVQKQTKRTRSK